MKKIGLIKTTIGFSIETVYDPDLIIKDDFKEVWRTSVNGHEVWIDNGSRRLGFGFANEANAQLACDHLRLLRVTADGDIIIVAASSKEALAKAHRALRELNTHDWSCIKEPGL